MGYFFEMATNVTSTSTSTSLHDRSSSLSLGKRKREDSEEVEVPKINGTTEDTSETLLSRVFNLLRKHDSTPSILKHPLRPRTSSEPEAKRARLSLSDDASLTIEQKYQAKAYPGIEDLVRDFNTAIDSLFNIPSSGESLVNGNHTQSTLDDDSRRRLENIKHLLNNNVIQSKQLGISMEENTNINGFRMEDDARGIPQVLTMRNYTSQGPRQVYTNLVSGSSDRISPRSLPGGFDLTDPLPTNVHADANRKSRTFGDVFRSRNVKQLELPRSGPLTASRHLKLESPLDVAFNRITSSYKNDYAFARIPAGEWLSYGSGTTSMKALPHQPEEKADDILGSKSEYGRLFQKAFSSFAPTCDKSSAIVPQSARNAAWWDKSGSKQFEEIFSVSNTETNIEEVADDTELTSDPSTFAIDPSLFSDLDEDPPSTSEIATTDELLAEVSDMIETVSSLQHNRQLQDNRLKSTTEPSQTEIDEFEILRAHLSLIVTSLPPFAVAKLNGDKLRELNVSTNLVLGLTDYSGSTETDGYNARRQVPATVPTASAQRPAVPNPAPIRPNSYQNQQTANLASYNARARAYNAASGAQGYVNSTPNANNYQTPRPSSTAAQPQYLPRPPYQQSTTPYSPQPSVQQFQRPISNGYQSYSGSNTNTSTSNPYVQRPSQPGYQQRAQDRDSASLSAYGRSASPQTPQATSYQTQQYLGAARSASPQKPATNGQPGGQQYNYSPQRYQTPQQPQAQAAAQTIQSYSPRPTNPYAGNEASVTANANTSANANYSGSSSDTAQRERIDQLKQQLEQRGQQSQGQGENQTGFDGAADEVDTDAEDEVEGPSMKREDSEIVGDIAA